MKKFKTHYIENVQIKVSKDGKSLLAYFNTTTGSFCIPINANYLRVVLANAPKQKNDGAA